MSIEYMIPEDHIKEVMLHKEFIEKASSLSPMNDIAKYLFKLHNSYLAGNFGKKEEKITCHVSRGKVLFEFRGFIKTWEADGIEAG